MAMFNPAHPGELIRETIEAIREETGEKLTIEEVAHGLATTRKTLSAIINGKQSVTPVMTARNQITTIQDINSDPLRGLMEIGLSEGGKCLIWNSIK